MYLRKNTLGVCVPREKSLDETLGQFITQINTPGTARRNQDNKPLFRKHYNDLEAIRINSLHALLSRYDRL